MAYRTAFYHDNNRNLICVLDPENGQTYFTYDPINRLTSVKSPWGEVTYYDPSYGVTTTGASDYTPNADAWQALIYDPNRSPDPYQFQWRRRSSSPAVDVRFSDED